MSVNIGYAKQRFVILTFHRRGIGVKAKYSRFGRDFRDETRYNSFTFSDHCTQLSPNT